MASSASAGTAPLDVLSRFVADLRWVDVPAVVRDSARNRTLDALACGVGALRAEAVQRVLATLFDEEGGDDADDQSGLDALSKGYDECGDHEFVRRP